MSTYLLINIAIIILPFFLSFDNKVSFYKKWKYAFPAIILVAIPFIIWDNLFTKAGVWSFNPEHLSGIYISELPLEEVLFFFTVPYASLFTHETLEVFHPGLKIKEKTARIITVLLSIILISSGFIFLEKMYTSTTFISLALILIVFHFGIRSKRMGSVYIAYSVLLFPFFLFNGLLTGTLIENPVVSYSPEENLGIRLISIPIEDVFYGMLLILLNISLFEAFRKKLRAKSLVN